MAKKRKTVVRNAFMLRLNPELSNEVTAIADRAGMSRNELIESWLSFLVEQDDLVDDMRNAGLHPHSAVTLMGYSAWKLCELGVGGEFLDSGCAEADEDDLRNAEQALIENASDRREKKGRK